MKVEKRKRNLAENMVGQEAKDPASQEENMVGQEAKDPASQEEEDVSAEKETVIVAENNFFSPSFQKSI